MKSQSDLLERGKHFMDFVNCTNKLVTQTYYLTEASDNPYE